MNRLLTLTTIVLFLTLGPASFEGIAHDHSHSEGSHSHGGGDDELQTVSGEVVDLSCYLEHKAKGPGHRKCAISCAKKGLPREVSL